LEVLDAENGNPLKAWALKTSGLNADSEG